MSGATAQRPSGSAGRALALVATLGLVLTACGPSPESIAEDACDLGERMMEGDVGFMAGAQEAGEIVSEAQEADIGLGEVMEASRDACPEAAGVLPPLDALPF